MTTTKRIALVLMIIGAINWGLIGFLNFDLVAAIFGGQTTFLSRVVYALVGISGLIGITALFDSADDRDEADNPITGPFNYSTEFGEDMDVVDRDDDPSI